MNLEENSLQKTPCEELLAQLLASYWHESTAIPAVDFLRRIDPQGWRRTLAYHGLAGVLLRYCSPQLDALNRACLVDIVREENEKSVMAAMQHLADLRLITAAYGQARLEWMLLKGLGLSQQIYNDPFIRPASDIDILVAPSAVADAARVLTENGFIPVDSGFLVGSLTRRQMMAATHQALLRSPSGVLIELHWRTGTAIDGFVDLLASASPMKIHQTEVNVVGPEHLRSYVAVHAAASLCMKWKWGVDLKFMPDRFPIRKQYPQAWEGITIGLMASALEQPGGKRLRTHGKVLQRATRIYNSRKAPAAASSNGVLADLSGRLDWHLYLLGLESGARNKLGYLRRHMTSVNPKRGQLLGQWLAALPGGALLFKLARRLVNLKNSRRDATRMGARK